MSSAKLQQLPQQTLVMSSKLRQAIDLLQYTQQDLQSILQQKIIENPFLELESDGIICEHGTQIKEPEIENVDTFLESPHYTDSSIDFIEYPSSGHSKKHQTSATDILEKVVAPQKDLQSHLIEQLWSLPSLSYAQQKTCEYIIYCLDETGYPRHPTTEISQTLSLDLADVEDALKHVQTLEPTGIGARSLQECLSLQLQEQNNYDASMEKVLQHLEYLATYRLLDYSKKIGISISCIQKSLEKIRKCDPKPGLQYSVFKNISIVPDVIVIRDTLGWRVKMSERYTCAIRVNKHIYEGYKNKAHSSEEKSFMRSYYTEATWLKKALQQRQENILKVAQEIVRQQEKFFSAGLRFLKPLTLKDISEELGIHESTVSRVTTGKYMRTPLGLYEMKFFFTSKITSNRSDQVYSSLHIKDLILSFIRVENPMQPISDETLSQMLTKSGMHVARRTIAKYRENLGIPSSSKRKQKHIFCS